MNNLLYFNSYGGFTKDYKEYHILNKNTPLPWCNVIANEKFGSIISTSGTIYTYYKNSREFKLTNWCNDWTNVVLGEKFSGIFDNNYTLKYGFGYVNILQTDDEVSKSMDIFIPINDNFKVHNINLKNNSKVTKKIVIEYNLDLVLGVSYDKDNENVIIKNENDMLLF
ncbi:MAG: hypothetical protein RSF67_07495, partial [Clostridia bacterium]